MAKPHKAARRGLCVINVSNFWQTPNLARKPVLIGVLASACDPWSKMTQGVRAKGNLSSSVLSWPVITSQGLLLMLRVFKAISCATLSNACVRSVRAFRMRRTVLAMMAFCLSGIFSFAQAADLELIEYDVDAYSGAITISPTVGDTVRNRDAGCYGPGIYLMGSGGLHRHQDSSLLAGQRHSPLPASALPEDIYIAIISIVLFNGHLLPPRQ